MATMPASTRSPEAGASANSGAWRRRRGRLSRETIVEVAQTILDEQGVEGLSMRALADAVGCSTMALYRHVRDRRDLEIAVARRVSGELAVGLEGPADDPEQFVGHWMREIRAHWLRHPWFGHMLGTHPELADVMAEVGDELVSTLRRGGASERLAGEELLRISRVTLGVVLIEQAAPLSEKRRRSASTHASAATSGVARAVAAYDDDQLFEHVIQTTWAGFQARLEESRQRRGHPHVHH